MKQNANFAIFAALAAILYTQMQVFVLNLKIWDLVLIVLKF